MKTVHPDSYGYCQRPAGMYITNSDFDFVGFDIFAGAMSKYFQQKKRFTV